MHYVSLGSSFASGPGIPPIVHRVAFRSGKNYPSVLANNLKVDKHTDLTAAGATLDNLTTQSLRGLPAQLEKLPSDADIITITAGGNDLGFIGGLMKSTFAKGMMGRMMFVKADDTSKAIPSDEDMIKKFHILFSGIRKKVPNAKVILVGYPVVLGAKSTSQNTGLSDTALKNYKDIGEKLEKVSKQACKGQDRVHYISLQDQSAEHAVGSDDPWVYGPDNVLRGFFWGGPIAWHPSPKGMEEIAHVIQPHIERISKI